MKKLVLFSCMVFMQLSAEHPWGICEEQQKKCPSCSTCKRCDDTQRASMKNTFDLEWKEECSSKGCNDDTSELITGLES